ncbi:tRNA uridine-5-carboxymethylaminomethyl(34) synthesis GTPase MnmE [Novimethylophilus kurashikiensis]|uniref:tRNA uridine-5-carboxymethylaminomethyl(34) synthesis GTPase MnmE n=1 Tax=Novimethylophilus kurashikiensis TaxID=1825523 RepID=UPI001D1318C7|nr:tRNA uridine-5-carboxymethylaminomethyl(34) synthesis GTPase MnmE [Novimethylophilus kurashikiensis]
MKAPAKVPRPDEGTIAAIATAPGRGGIGVIRVSGRAAPDIAVTILGRCPSPRHATYIDFLDTDGSTIDRGIAIYFPAPHSYTGENILELQGHGGTAVLQRLLQRCLALGAKLAEPGEFTKRAYLNDKLDLAQAEAVADLIDASTDLAARSAMRSLSGEFSSHVHALRERLINLRMYVEACLDFPEEDIDFITEGGVIDKLESIRNELSLLSTTAKQGSILREGIQVVLIGQPNVGKSSLMNQLAGQDIAIVTAIAGTTRDTIRSEIQLEGVPIHVIDTAGLRETVDEVEIFGIQRTWRAAETAHIALILVDATHGITENEKSILARLSGVPQQIWIHNKIDLVNSSPEIREVDGKTHIFLSAKTGHGISLLKQHLLELAGWRAGTEGVFMARQRHLKALDGVSQSIENAKKNLNQAELLAEDLRLAQESLNEITGEFTSDDLLGEIFGRFCIGK